MEDLLHCCMSQEYSFTIRFVNKSRQPPVSPSLSQKSNSQPPQGATQFVKACVISPVTTYLHITIGGPLASCASGSRHETSPPESLTDKAASLSIAFWRARYSLRADFCISLCSRRLMCCICSESMPTARVSSSKLLYLC